MSTNDQRELVRRLSHAAAVLDRSLCGPPERGARGVDYQERQRQLEQQARRELCQLREQLSALPLK
jgi:hypothetical protein